MKLGWFNCPNSARLLKCTVFSFMTSVGIVAMLSFLQRHLTIQIRLAEQPVLPPSNLASRDTGNVVPHTEAYRQSTDVIGDRITHQPDVRTKSKPVILRYTYSTEYIPFKVCVPAIGRLGNRMFQYASSFGISKQKGMALSANSHDDLANIFNLSAIMYEEINYCGHAVKRYAVKQCAFDRNLSNFAVDADVVLLDYLQSWMYFHKYAEDLRKEFTFQEHIWTRAKEIFHNSTSSSIDDGHNGTPTYVGLHIRHGDILRDTGLRRRGYNVAPKRYIYNAMSYFMERFQSVRFIVCSDDMTWVKTEFGKYKFLMNMIFIEPNQPAVDLAILSMCTHTIMTTGTFGWWTGWLAGGTTVYYKDFVRPNSELWAQFSEDFSDFFLPTWIGL